MSIGNTTFPDFPDDGDPAYAAKLITWKQYIEDLLSPFIGTDSLDITATVDVQGNRIVNVLGLRHSETGDPGTPLSTWFDTNGNYWLRDGANNAIQIVGSGAVLGGSGSIGGDYAAASALVTYSSSGTKYTFLTNASGGTAADIEGGSLHIRVPGGTSNAVILKAPTLSGDLSITFPGAYPATQAAVTVDHTGTMAFNEALVLDGRGITISGSVHTAGSLTGSAFSYTADVRKVVSAADAFIGTGGCTPVFNLFGVVGYTGLDSGKAVYPLDLDVGDTFTGYYVNINKVSNGSFTLFSKCYKYNTADNTITQIGPGIADVANANGRNVLSETGFSSGSLSGYEYFVVVSSTSAADIVYSTEYTKHR